MVGTENEDVVGWVEDDISSEMVIGWVWDKGWGRGWDW